MNEELSLAVYMSTYHSVVGRGLRRLLVVDYVVRTDGSSSALIQLVRPVILFLLECVAVKQMFIHDVNFWGIYFFKICKISNFENCDDSIDQPIWTVKSHFCIFKTSKMTPFSMHVLYIENHTVVDSLNILYYQLCCLKLPFKYL